MKKIEFKTDEFAKLITPCPHGLKNTNVGGIGCQHCKAHVAMRIDIRTGINTTGVVDCGYEEPVVNKADEEVLDRFVSHAINGVQANLMGDYRGAFISLVQKVNELPGSREKSIILTKLEEAQFYTTACIARRLKS